MPGAIPTNEPPPQGAPAWTPQELRQGPHQRQDKPAKVRAMFAAIARSYDLNNRVHSFWQDERWRRRAVRLAALRAGEHVLDVACGTGDLSQAFARARPAPARVVGLDTTAQMLEVARHKQAQARARHAHDPAGAIEYVLGDALALPYAPGSFDVVSIAFGIRNVADPSAALREFFRVLRRGGRLVVLEFDRPSPAPVRWVSDLYTRRVMPLTATLISGDRSGAYRYLPRSVETFMSRQEMGRAITSAGFIGWRAQALTMGVCVCHRAEKA